MLTKIKLVLVTGLLALTSTVALAPKFLRPHPLPGQTGHPEEYFVSRCRLTWHPRGHRTASAFPARLWTRSSTMPSSFATAAACARRA